MRRRPSLQNRIFQSTLPAGEATGSVCSVFLYRRISIHASRGGSDFRFKSVFDLFLRFQSTLPAGEATMGFTSVFNDAKFQSTLPAGEATTCRTIQDLSGIFQSTLPAGEATVRSSCPLITARSSMGSANRDFPVFLSAVSMLFFFWALGVRAYRIMVSLGSYPFFVPI